MRSFVDSDGVEYEVDKLSSWEVEEIEINFGISVLYAFNATESSEALGVRHLRELLYLALKNKKGKSSADFAKSLREEKFTEALNLASELLDEFKPKKVEAPTDPTAGEGENSKSSPQSRDQMKDAIASEK